MRRALIADIHGNLIALNAVLDDCAKQNVDEIVCLGDMVGFGPDPVECVDQVMDRCAWSLCGDHEFRLLSMAIENINPFAKKALQRERALFESHWYSSTKRKHRWQWLNALAPTKTVDGVLYVHGSPRDPLMEYVMQQDFLDDGHTKAKEVFNSFRGTCFSAHTHIPGIVSTNFQWFRPSELVESTYTINGEMQTLVNIGSVGQPRDGDPRSCYVIWNDATQTIMFRRVPYDLEAIKKRFANVLELDERLYLRLEKGM